MHIRYFEYFYSLSSLYTRTRCHIMKALRRKMIRVMICHALNFAKYKWSVCYIFLLFDIKNPIKCHHFEEIWTWTWTQSVAVTLACWKSFFIFLIQTHGIIFHYVYHMRGITCNDGYCDRAKITTKFPCRSVVCDLFALLSPFLCCPCKLHTFIRVA